MTLFEIHPTPWAKNDNGWWEDANGVEIKVSNLGYESDGCHSPIDDIALCVNACHSVAHPEKLGRLFE